MSGSGPAGRVVRIPLPNPFFEGEINTWLIEDDPLTLVDAGLNSPESLAALEAGLAKLGRRIEEIERLVLTHRHPDHVGLSRAIQERSGAEVLIHPDDQVVFSDPAQRAADFPKHLARELGAWGAPREALEPVVAFFEQTSVTVPEVSTFPLVEGDVLPGKKCGIRVHHTPGHSQGHVVLEYGEHLLVGDHVLERITPNVGSGEFHARGTLKKYLEGLERIAGLCHEGTIACPGHGGEFRTLAARAREIAAHHAEREEKVLSILRQGGGMSVYQMATALFGAMGTVHLMLGMGEAFAHLDKLESAGRIRNRGGRFELS